MRAFAAQWETSALMVADAAFYSEPNLQAVGAPPWLSRVPQPLKAAQTLVDRSLKSLSEMGSIPLLRKHGQRGEN
ncbi:MAG: hypothetical protein HC886_21470 [Leptolyngbyaceae cyanobacterium SM1_1_3]|nr:hypothetical protein [Leptolyngbyaceae cyanobacterium SM1_1_3]NJN01244.1 hypothetical protein [Leptolyngbyaceae cyanobacterium RM1_1_2]NJO11950.1 hypothetical protein [Leptolyngbyaceae cyanobacterium SL_1_1]